MSDVQKIERDERQQRREEIRERALALDRGMSTRSTAQEINPPDSGYDRQEEGVEEEEFPMEEELWIEQPKSLQLRAPHEGTTLSPVNPRTQIQTIVEEELRLGTGDFGIWSRLDDETYTGRHLIIH